KIHASANISAGPISQFSTSEVTSSRRSAPIRRVSSYRTLARTGYIMTNSPTAIGTEIPPILTVSRAAPRPGTKRPSSNPAAIASTIHIASHRSTKDISCMTGAGGSTAAAVWVLTRPGTPWIDGYRCEQYADTLMTVNVESGHDCQASL